MTHVNARHPSLTCYVNHGCRCPGCRRINAARMRAWRRRKVESGTHRILHGRLIPIDGPTS